MSEFQDQLFQERLIQDRLKPINNRAEVNRLLYGQWDSAARVPAIEITHADWQAIQFIVRELAALSQDFEATDLSHTLVQGTAVQEAVIRAKSLRHFVETQE